MPTDPIPYIDDVETLLANEDAIADETIATMQHTMQQVFEEHRHGLSGTHAKTHGVAVGTMTVADDLPPELAQGLFAQPGRYDVLLRLASEPGEIDPDTEKRARGAALKVMDVPGEKLVEGWTSQDFLFNTWPIIPQGDAATYLEVIKQRDRYAGHHKRVVAATAVHHPSLKETIFDRTPNLHPLAFRYYSQAAFRYGDHVAKFALVPAPAQHAALVEREVSKDDPPGVLRQWVQEYFADHDVTFEFRVQLCTDLGSMPVEDASAQWSEDASPYRTVATITLPAQDSFDTARRVFAEDRAAWRPWNGLTAHRPLGSLNRLRRRVYDELGQVRHDTNAVEQSNPVSPAEIPHG